MNDIKEIIQTFIDDYKEEEELKSNFIDYLNELKENNYLKRLRIDENRIVIEINKKRRLRIHISNNLGFGFGTRLVINEYHIKLDNVYFEKEKITHCWMTLSK